MATREIVVNMVPGRVTPVIHVSQYDDGYGITANLIENSGTYTVPTGATVSIEGTKPDGHGYAYLCTYQDNAVVIPVNTQMTAVKGKHPCELVVRKEGLRVGSKNMIMAVEVAGLGEDTIISDTELPAIIALAQEQEEAAAASATAAASSAASAETAKDAAIEAAETAQAAEAWAVGQRDGVDVPSTDETYHNNSKYYAGQAGTAASSAASSATSASSSASSASSSASNASSSKTAAANSATAAASSASQARTSATQAASSAASAETAKDAAMDAAQDAIDAAQELQTAVQFNAALIHDTASGVVASFADGADNIPMKSIVAEITPVQSGTGDPSPTNIRPISGRTGVTVTRAGKNLFSPDNLIFGYWIRNEWHPVGETWCGVIIPVVAGMQVHVSGNHCFGGVNLAWLTSRTDPSAGLTGQTEPATSSVNNTTFTAPTGALGLWFPQYISQTQPIDMSELMIEYGASASAYEPYRGASYPISWETDAGTIYGGTLDVVSGVLTVDRVMETITKDGTWYLFVTGSGNASAVIQLRGYQNVKYVEGASSRNGAIASTGVEAQNYWVGARQNEIPPDGDMCFAYSSSGQLRFHRSDVANITDLETFKAAFPDTQIVYPLATPQTYQLTPTEVRTLLGGNNIYTDAGSVSVEYVADTKLYIDNKVAELQALILEH